MAIAHFVFGSIFRVYDLTYPVIRHFDKMMHAASGAVFVPIGFSFALMLIDKSKPEKKPLLLAALFGIFFSITIAVLWEFFEFAMDSFFGFNMQRWQDTMPDIETGYQGSGLIDTMLDMIWHTVGSAVAVIIGVIWFTKRPDDTRVLVMQKSKALSAGYVIGHEAAEEADKQD